MQRCIDLAKLGAGNVAPNPMVGAVLVHNYRIIGEGYHKKYGEAHAEVNCINNVKEDDKKYISDSTLYVSLEPCAHYGKTPPCANLIIQHKIKKVVIGCRDSFEKVNGKGIELLQNAGVEVISGVLEKECINLNKRFFVFNTAKRPYIILKWAQTKNGIIGNKSDERLFITNELTNKLVHKWRSEESAVLVGYNTALKDNPQLDARNWNNKEIIRMVIDKNLSIPASHHLYNNKLKTVFFNFIKTEQQNNTAFFKLDESENILPQIMQYCYNSGIQSILVEGGAATLQHFINEKLYDEVRIITNESMSAEDGIIAPELKNTQLNRTEKILSDSIAYYTK